MFPYSTLLLGEVVALADATIYLAERRRARGRRRREEAAEEEEEESTNGGPSLRFTGRRVFKRVYTLYNRD